MTFCNYISFKSYYGKLFLEPFIFKLSYDRKFWKQCNFLNCQRIKIQNLHSEKVLHISEFEVFTNTDFVQSWFIHQFVLNADTTIKQNLLIIQQVLIYVHVPGM